VSWAWWDCPLTWLTNYRPSVLLHCWLGHLTRKTVSKMTYNVSSGTLNSTIPYMCLIHTGILTTLENLFDARGREWCLRQASKSVFSLVWPWPLTSWTTQLMFHGRAPPTTCVDIGSFVLKTSCSLVWWKWQSRKDVRHSGDKNQPLSTKSTEWTCSTLATMSTATNCRIRLCRQCVRTGDRVETSWILMKTV